MTFDEQTYHQISDYVDGALHGEKLSEFESRLQHEPSLLVEVEAYRLANEIALGASRHAIRNELSHSLKQHQRTKRHKRLFGLGGALLTLGIVLLIIWPQEKYTPPTKEVEHLNKPHGATGTKTKPTVQSKELQEEDKQHAVINNSLKPKEVIITPEPEEVSYTITSEALVAPPKSNDTLPKENTIEPAVETPSLDIIEGEKETVDCKLIKWQLTPRITPSCNGDGDGIIDLAGHIDGGTPPYEIRLDYEPVRATITRLPPGFYGLRVEDANGCVHYEELEIPMKTCAPKSLEFNSTYETIKMILPYVSGQLSIHNRAGQEVYRAYLEDDIRWNGQGTNGALVPVGLYIYTIKTDDGQVFSGQITVTN